MEDRFMRQQELVPRERLRTIEPPYNRPLSL